MKTISKTILALAAAAMISAGSAYAVPIASLTISDGTTTIVVTDGGASDSNPLSGVITWIGAIGVWNINVDTGFTKPAIGSTTNPNMDLSFAANSTALGMLTLTFADSGFTFSGTAMDALGGTQGNGSVTDSVQVNGNSVLSLGPLTSNPFTGTASGGITLTPTDTLSLVLQINHTGSGMTTGDKSLTVPEGGSAVALLGIALAGIEGVRRALRARRA